MTYTIKVIDSYNGDIKPGKDQTVEEGGSVVFTFSPHLGYVIEDVFIDNESVGELDTYTFTNVTENHSIYVRYGNIETMCDKVAFNRYNTIRDAGYKIIEQLIKNNDDIWRLLKYNTPDALNKDFLTLEEKRGLIFEGTTNPDAEDYRVFRQPFLDDAFDSQVSQLRVYLLTMNPENRSVGTVGMALECVCHNKILSLSNYENRLEVMVQQLLQTLNGIEVGGIGELVFDDNSSFFDLASLNMYNNRNFLGYTLVMSVKVGDLTGAEQYAGLFG